MRGARGGAAAAFKRDQHAETQWIHELGRELATGFVAPPPWTENVQCWRWRFADPAIPLTAAIRAGAALRRAVFEAHARDFPDDFHKEAYWLVEDEDDDGVIDHALVFHARGIAPDLVAALARTRGLWFDDVRAALVPDWMGRPAHGGLFGPARVWRAATPYVPPLWRTRGKAKARRQGPRETYDRDAQLRESPALRSRALAEIGWADAIDIGGEAVPAWAFETERIVQRRDDEPVSRRISPPADARAAMGFPLLRFERPAWGPIALGFGAHFGLGLFHPVE